MLIIACLDGAFGFRGIIQRLKQRNYMSDIVIEQMGKIFVNDNPYDFHIKTGRGSAFYVPTMKRFLAQYNNAGNNLLLVGKSKGGHWINRIAKMDCCAHYKKRHLILVDACWLGRHNKNIYPPINYDKVYNFYQSNENFVNGAWIANIDGYPDKIKQKKINLLLKT